MARPAVKELQVSVSISEYPEELQVRSETSGKIKLRGRKCSGDDRL